MDRLVIVGGDAAGMSTAAQARRRCDPGAAPLTVKVVAEHRGGRLLGAQIVGEEGAAKRIGVFATALWADMTVEELLNVDLSFAPPLAPLWDPVFIAARRTWQRVEADAA